MDYSKYNSFKEWMYDTYEHPDWENINYSGCENGVSGLIYYEETNAIYDTFAHELHDVIAEFKAESGEMPNYIIRHLDNATSFKNAVVWFVAEWYASQYMFNWEANHESEGV